MLQAKVFVENIFRLGVGDQQFVRERAKIIKGNQGGTRAVGGETKRKLSSNFYCVSMVGVR